MTRPIGTTVLILGLIGAAYGAVAFFVLQTLPPNDEVNGRLPSLYILLAGMGVMLLGAAIRGLRRHAPE